MARSNGPFGPPETRPPLRRDSLATLSQPAAQWPTQPFPDHGQPAQAGPAYHFPPAEPAADYGYNPQPYGQPQWGQPGDQRGYGVAGYLPADPPPFQQTAHHQQGYADADADYADEFYEDEEPRRGRRWILIAAALVGAIGVGGALAYTYRSLVAPNARVPLVKAEPAGNVKVRPDQRGGKEFPGADKKLPSRLEGTTAAVPPQKAEQEPDGPEAGGEERNLGPKSVKTIPIGSQPTAVAPSPVTAVPGITLQNVGPPPRAEQPQAQPKVVPPPSAGRVSTGQQPAAAEGDDDDPPAPAAPPIKRPQPVAPSPPPQQVAVKVPSPPRAAPPPPAASSGLGYVVVLASKKTHMDAFKAYADAVEKHPQVLNGKTPDVQQADLGEKGIWYRAVVGPLGSREAAMSLCGQLKAAGQDCWVKAF